MLNPWIQVHCALTSSFIWNFCSSYIHRATFSPMVFTNGAAIPQVDWRMDWRHQMVQMMWLVKVGLFVKLSNRFTICEWTDHSSNGFANGAAAPRFSDHSSIWFLNSDAIRQMDLRMERRRRDFQTIRQSDFRMVPLFVKRFCEWWRYLSNGFPSRDFQTIRQSDFRMVQLFVKQFCE